MKKIVTPTALMKILGFMEIFVENNYCGTLAFLFPKGATLGEH